MLSQNLITVYDILILNVYLPHITAFTRYSNMLTRVLCVNVVYFHHDHPKSHLVRWLVRTPQRQSSHPLLPLHHLDKELILKNTKTLSENAPRILFPLIYNVFALQIENSTLLVL